MRQGQSQIDRATLGNEDIKTDRAGFSPGRKKKADMLYGVLTELPGA